MARLNREQCLGVRRATQTSSRSAPGLSVKLLGGGNESGTYASLTSCNAVARRLCDLVERGKPFASCELAQDRCSCRSCLRVSGQNVVLAHCSIVNHQLGGGKRIESVTAHSALFSSKKKDSTKRLRHTNNVGVWSGRIALS